ncbi:MAG: hypothetical protein FWG63_04505 [Defluviitaleaceae bacterium]|nr:hypothetical protein [Defluviitaleaceae bacterium]
MRKVINLKLMLLLVFSYQLLKFLGLGNFVAYQPLFSVWGNVAFFVTMILVAAVFLGIAKTFEKDYGADFSLSYTVIFSAVATLLLDSILHGVLYGQMPVVYFFTLLGYGFDVPVLALYTGIAMFVITWLLMARTIGWKKALSFDKPVDQIKDVVRNIYS